MSGFAGIGTSFQKKVGAVWTAIADVKSISGPSCSRDTIDVTTLASTGGYREFIGALRDGGDVSLSMNFTVAGYTLMKNDFESEALQDYRIVLSDTANTTLEFSGLVTELPLDVPVDDVITCDVTIKVSGATTLTSVDEVVEVADITDIAVALNTQLADVGLPATATVTFDDDSTASVDVVWNTGNPMYDGGTGGAYVFTGTLTMGAGQDNPDGLTASVTVNVASA